ncbi:hypothetical protein EG329_005413 [Mollisiaceae sp. DMI_Dod_QoI]|nr:hypothetical protein EG329_005413 [Helotiales sp. DMI_Dod_QoI]
MAAASQEDHYVLGRGVSESIRLDAQHLLWRMYLGYVLQPQIPITNGMKIAELGTGTGIWLFDAARLLPPTVSLHGYDICSDQFPSKSLWPENITLGLLDSLVYPPTALIGQYDVVHLRMWASNLRENNTTPLIQHIKRLLKPGGYIQWEDADLVNQEVRGEDAEHFAEMMRTLFKRAGLQYEWVSDLRYRLPQQGFDIIQASNRKFEYDLIQLCTSTYLMALVEILKGIERNSIRNQLISVAEHEEVLYGLLQKSRNGMVYNWIPITVLGQKIE